MVEDLRKAAQFAAEYSTKFGGIPRALRAGGRPTQGLIQALGACTLITTGHSFRVLVTDEPKTEIMDSNHGHLVSLFVSLNEATTQTIDSDDFRIYVVSERVYKIIQQLKETYA